MYDRIIFSARFKRLVWPSLFFCLYFWCLCGSALASRFDEIITDVSQNSPSEGNYIPGAENGYYVVWKVDPKIIGTAASSSPNFYVKWTNAIGSTINPLTQTTGVKIQKVTSVQYSSGPNAGKWRYDIEYFYVNYTTSAPQNLPSDSDGDGIKDDIDPCIDSPDDNFTVYRLKNHCTGSYYIFQVTGSCGKTKTYYNPIYSSLSSALDDASNSPECNPVGNGDRISMRALDFEKWFDDSYDDVSDGGELPDQTIPDPTGGNSTSPGVPPAQADPDNPSNQKLLYQIERLKAGLENTITSSSNKVASQVEISGNQIVSNLNHVQGAINGLGSGLSSVGSAIGTASGQAHTDANMLAAKLDAITSGLEGVGGGNATVSGGMSAEEMDDSFQKNREETYKVETGAFGSIEDSQQGFFNAFTSRATEMKNRVLNLIPDMAVDASSPDPCVPESTVTLSGYSVLMPEICLDQWEQYFVLLGNVLYAAAGIGCILTIFGFRG